MKLFEPFRLDKANGCLWRDGAQILLPPKPFAVLEYLAEHPGRLITHDELLDALWPETYVQPQVLRTYMLELRKVLGDDAGQPRFIQTVPKRGYCFVAAVSEIPGPDWTGSHRIIADPPAPNQPIPDQPASSRQAVERSTSSTSAPGIAAPPKSTGFVNRTSELAQLTGELALLAEGQRRVVFVTGEAGIGKTALVDAFCQQESSAIVARGQCLPGVGGKEEYYPVMEALGHLCSSPDGDAACRVLARVAPGWLARLGRSIEAATAPAAAQERMMGELCGALEELSAARPLILVLEDLHWADDATLNLISALARRRAQARLMVLATYRLRSVPPEHPLKALMQDLRLRKLCTEVALAPLTRTSVAQLVSAELKQESLPEGLSAFVHRHSEGNPLFAIAIVEHLIAQRCLVRAGNHAASAWELRISLDQAEAGVPDELAQMVELEIERLTPLEQCALEAGSLMRVAFPAWAVAAALEKDAVEVEELCDGLVRKLHFVERAGQDELPNGSCSAFYVFGHELYREVLYRRQAAARRARRHVRIADRLRELFAGREADVAREMAIHYEAAGDWPRAALALRTAAQHAESRQAHAEAAELREHALRMDAHLDEGERTAEALKH